MDHNRLMALQDDCLNNISDGKKPPYKALRSLPPWRAVLIARVALEAGLVTDEELHDLVEEAKMVGGDGHLSFKRSDW